MQEEKNNALTLALDRDQTIKNAIKQVDEMRKDLSNALHAAASAENRAAVAEVLSFFLSIFIEGINILLSILNTSIQSPITLYLFVIIIF